MKVTFEFDTSSENFDIHELECHNIKWTVQTDKTPAKNEIEWFD